MISVKTGLPETKNLVSDPVRFVVEGKVYAGHYHDNGWFYNDYRDGHGLYMAQGPKAKCGRSSWDLLPKHKVTEWEYA